MKTTIVLAAKTAVWVALMHMGSSAHAEYPCSVGDFNEFSARCVYPTVTPVMFGAQCQPSDRDRGPDSCTFSDANSAALAWLKIISPNCTFSISPQGAFRQLVSKYGLELHAEQTWSGTGACSTGSINVSTVVYRARDAICPSRLGGQRNNARRTPVTLANLCYKQYFDPTPEPGPNAGRSCNDRGNPINIATGNKHQTESDYVSSTLRIERTYNWQILESGYAFVYSLGPNWKHNYDLSVFDGSGTLQAVLVRGDGKVLIYSSRNGSYRGEGDSPNFLLRLRNAQGDLSGWRHFNLRDNAIEEYSKDGRLTAVFYAAGKSIAATYSTPMAAVSDDLVTIADSFDRRLTFVRDSQRRIRSIDLPNGTRMTYEYGGLTGIEPNDSEIGKPLTSITYPDLSTRLYLYNEPANTSGQTLVSAMTGIIDEEGKRFANYRYNDNADMVLSENAGAVNRYTLQLDFAAQRSFVVDPMGTSSAVDWVINNRVRKIVLATQPAGSGCSASTSAQTYDPNGNIASRDDFNGYRVCYAHDQSRNVELVRVEGLVGGAACSPTAPGLAIPAGSRKTSTQWHPDWQLRSRVAEPGRITTSVYNGQPDPYAGGALASCAPTSALLPDGKPIAVLCRQIEQATDNADGALGFAAPVQAGVPAREQRWTYNQHGQVLTHDGPRTDVADITVHQYYGDTAFTGTDPNAVGHTRGDLQQATSPAGHVTRYTLYNKLGQLLQMVDPNGVVTEHTYDLRQRLTSTSVAGQLTAYSYWPTGLLKRVTQPDGSWLHHDHDDAQRLVRISDNLGNSVSYTLDNMGNRTAEEVRDPGNSLRRVLTRSIDALGRVQQITGRE